MRKIRRFCTISIFLSALFSGRAQDWDLRAVEYERIIFEGADLQEVNGALLAKAECYKQGGRYAEAAATLARVRMYLLPDEEREKVLFQKELCSYLSGDFESAASYIGEMADRGADALRLHSLVLAHLGRYEESKAMAEACTGPSEALDRLYAGCPSAKSGTAAMAWAFLPPLGHFYTRNYGEGLLSLGLNAAAAGWMVWNIVGGYYVTGFLGGAIALNYTFMGNQERTACLVEQYNAHSRLAFCKRLQEFWLAEGR